MSFITRYDISLLTPHCAIRRLCWYLDIHHDYTRKQRTIRNTGIMKFLALATLAAFSGFAAAQISAIPQCALSCFGDAIAKTSCGLNTYCQCTSGAKVIQSSVIKCLCDTNPCSASELVRTYHTSSFQLGLPVAPLTFDQNCKTLRTKHAARPWHLARRHTLRKLSQLACARLPQAALVLQLVRPRARLQVERLLLRAPLLPLHHPVLLLCRRWLL